MRIGGIIKNDFSAAPGVCVSVFVQGCSMNPHCPGCHNPELQDFNGGRDLNDEEWASIVDAMKANGIHRDFCVMGGEPLDETNIITTSYLVTGIHSLFPDSKIYIWSGYTYKEIQDIANYHGLDDICDSYDMLRGVLDIADYLIDGPYHQEERDITLPMRGSRNQRIYDLATGKDVTDEFDRKAEA